MRYYWLSVLSVLAAVPLGELATPLAILWDDKRVKHTWPATPANWVSLGHPSSGTTIDLHIALKPHHENALIDALYEVSTPGHPKHVLANPLLTFSLTCATALFQIRRTPVQGTGR